MDDQYKSNRMFSLQRFCQMLNNLTPFTPFTTPYISFLLYYCVQFYND